MSKWPEGITDKFDRHWIPEPNSGCFLWMGACNENGYGIITRNGKNIKAHRFSYEREHGPIPDGLEIDHWCRNKCCVNPGHLEPVTHGENRKRVPREIVYHCAECGKELLRKHKNNRDDHAVRCVVCSHRDAQRAYDARNSGRKNEYYEKNRETLLQKAKDRYYLKKGK